MEILNYALVALVISTGLIAGAVIARFAKEEIKPGKKYFILLQKLLFIIAIALIMYANRTNVHFIWVGGLIIFLSGAYFVLVVNKIIPFFSSAGYEYQPSLPTTPLGFIQSFFLPKEKDRVQDL